MIDKLQALPNLNSKAYLVLSFIAISGEMEINSLYRLGSVSYIDKVIKTLKRDKLIKTYYSDKLRGVRVTAKAKKLLLHNNLSRYEFYLTGNSETNKPKGEITRRLRLFRISDTLITMHNSNICFLRDYKPKLFDWQIKSPYFYSSREIKELGDDFIKIKGSRMIGLLMSNDKVNIIYNIESANSKWSYKAEMRVKALVKMLLIRENPNLSIKEENISAILLGNSLDIAYEILSNTKNHNYFILDGNYGEFNFLTNDYYGETLLKLLCDTEKKTELDNMLLENTKNLSNQNLIDCDGLNKNSDFILLGYTLNLPRIHKFNHGLELYNKKGVIICFDFQKEILEKYCSKNISFEVINFKKFEGRFFK